MLHQAMEQKPVEKILKQAMQQNLVKASRTDAGSEARNKDAGTGNGSEASRTDAAASGQWSRFYWKKLVEQMLEQVMEQNIVEACRKDAGAVNGAEYIASQ